jgi:hypothetical protein
MNSHLAIGLGALLILSGGGIIVWESLEIERALASRRWPRVAGKILRFHREVKFGDDWDAYQDQVLCRYQVGDAELFCSRLHFGLRTWWPMPTLFGRARFKRIARRYAVTSQVPVAYNPEKPEESVLETGLTAMMIYQLLFGAVVFALGILLLRQQL